MKVQFETVDVFTDRRFGGNPLAIFLDAPAIDDATMQALAAEMNYSETTFVLPPQDLANTARVRIFNRTHEMPFAGHPMVGTAFVLAKLGKVQGGETARFEIPAGIAVVTLEKDGDGTVIGGEVRAPQYFKRSIEIPGESIARCLGLQPSGIVKTNHRPVIASAGNDYVLAEVTETAVGKCQPDIGAFRTAVAQWPELGGRFSILVYARDANLLHARMFAPLAGTWEDPATGSANAPLAGLLLSLGDTDYAEFSVRQGAEMGRPSFLRTTATQTADGIAVTVAGHCQPVFSGTIDL